MKKLVTMALLAAFAVGCTASIEDDYETEVQIIDKKDVEIPSDKKDKDD